MITRRLAIGGLLLVSSLAVCGCNRPVEVRYRVTVEVDDGGTVRTGSGVWSFALEKSALPLASPYNSRFRGEAIPVDLPGRGTLFALVDGVRMYPENLFGDMGRSRTGPPRYSDRIEDLRHIQTMIGVRADLVCVNPPWLGVRCPTLARFGDIRLPVTVEEVDPGNLTASFGPKVRLKRVSIQITDDPITTGIQKIIPWLPEYYDKRLDGNRYGKNTLFSNSLSSGSFSTEIRK
jgi:hypothetical protein